MQPPHTLLVWSMAWNPKGKRLATGSQDRTANLRDAATGKELLTLVGQRSGVSSVAWSPDSKWLATGSPDGTVQGYAMDTHNVMASPLFTSPMLSVPTPVRAPVQADNSMLSW